MANMESSATPEAFDAAGPAAAPAIVLVHGSVVTRKIWIPQLRSLSDAYRVIAPDLPGHGALAATPFTFDAAVSTLAAIIDREARGRAAVAGLSLGGYVAMELAARHPERVAGLVLAGCSRDLDGVVGIYVRVVGRLMRRGWLRPSRERMERKTLQLFPPALADVAEEQRRAGVYPEPVAEVFLGMTSRRWSEALALYPGPTLIVNGERDTMARKGEARFAAAARAGVVRTIANAGHACSLQQPAEFDRALRDFMTEIS